MYRFYVIHSIILISCLNVQISVQNLLHGPYHPQPVFEICSSYVYCQGELLDAVQTSKIYNSSKVFVDLQMNRREADILRDFHALKRKNNDTIPTIVLEHFIKQNFQADKLEKWIPPDFRDYPRILDYIQDASYREFLAAANQMWKVLARKIPEHVKMNRERHSMVYVPNGFFVNMEYHNEFSYWDTYWIIRGLLICGMEASAKGILQNFLYMVKYFGYVLTANRIYYEGRTQPPLLIQMMATYYSYTKDKDFILENIMMLDLEMMFWIKYRSVNVEYNGNSYLMSHYMSDTYDPRPEAYVIDVALAKQLVNKRDQNEFLCRIKAASESGWGLSSKHFHNRNHYDDLGKTLLKTNPLNFVYVELNSIMQSNANILSKMYLLRNDEVNSNFYKEISKRFQVGITALIWNEDEKIWLDFDTSTETSRNYFYASNLTPLWTGSYDEKLSEFYGDAAVDYLIKNNIINADLTPRFLCVPTSLYKTVFEWDYYNCWPQLQSMIIFGFQSTKSERAKRVAFNFASSWVKTNFIGYNQTKTFFEKYSAINLGKDDHLPSIGNLPKGYGVTIGVLFEIFQTWGDQLMSETF